jgi:peroxiredoxin
LSRYRDSAGKIADLNAQVIGVSVDSVWANKAFAEQLHVDYPILSDARHDASKAYGVFDDAGLVARRTTFVIDEQGVVRHIEQSKEALDPNGAINACPVPAKKKDGVAVGG